MLFRHYKGGLYRILVEKAFHSETDEEFVVYMVIETGIVRVRPFNNFYEWVDIGNETLTPRFTQVEEDV